MTRSPWMLSALLVLLVCPAWTPADEKKLPAPILLGTHKEGAQCLTFSPDGKTVASGGDDGVILLWDIPTRKERLRIETREHLLRALAFSPDGKTLASGGRDKVVTLWDTATGKATGTLPQTRLILSLAFSPDGKTLAVGANGYIKLHDLATGKETASLDPRKGAPVERLLFTPSGKQLIGGCGTTVRLWDVATRAEQASWEGVYPTLSSDGKTLVMAWDQFRLRDLATGKERTFPLANEVLGLDLDAEGRIMVTVEYDQALRLWDTRTGARLATSPDTNRHYRVVLSPDGRTVVFSGQSGKVYLWDVSGAR